MGTLNRDPSGSHKTLQRLAVPHIRARKWFIAFVLGIALGILSLGGAGEAAQGQEMPPECRRDLNPVELFKKPQFLDSILRCLSQPGQQPTQRGPVPEPPLSSVPEMMGRINRFWEWMFERCGAPPYTPPAVRVLNDQEAWRARSDGAMDYTAAMYIPSFRNHRYPLFSQNQTVYIYEPDLFADRSAPRPTKYGITRGANIRVPSAYTAEVTLAHEVGHRVQDLIGTANRSVLTPDSRRRQELEADLFAGAYVRWLMQNNIVPIGMITAGNISSKEGGDDVTGRPRYSLQSHGTSQERGDAFMKGVGQGLPTDFCTTGIAYP